MLDHATGIVIGETAVVENDVSILQDVTLGGTGKECGDRHPKIREGVMIGAGAKILGNIEVGKGQNWLMFCSAASRSTSYYCGWRTGKIVGRPYSDKPSEDMDQGFNGNGHKLVDGAGI